jgi:hypothetical protein
MNLDFDSDIITSSVKRGWNAWKDNVVAYVLSLLFYGLLSLFLFACLLVLFLSAGVLMTVPAIVSGSIIGFFSVGLAGLLVGLLIAFICYILILMPLNLGISYMAIKGSRGDKVEIKDIFYAFNSGRYVRLLVFFIVYSIIMGILMLIPIVGWIAFFLLIYAIYIYMMTPSEGIVYAFKESFNTVKDNILVTLVAVIIYLILMAIGNLVFGLGLLITMPIAMVMMVAVLKQIRPDIADNAN